jgi:DNA-binding response OmpR family regulator
MSKAEPNRTRILWIEEQYSEYDLLDDLRVLAGGRDSVDAAPTMKEGYRLLTEEHYDLVLLDLMLPWTEQQYDAGLIQLNGGEWLLDQLRHSRDWATSQDCYVLVLTARGDKETLVRVKDLLGLRGEILNKPLPGEAILERVQSALRRAS